MAEWHGNTILRYGAQVNGRSPGTGCMPRVCVKTPCYITFFFAGRLGIHPAQVVCRALHGNTILRYGTQANGRTPGTGCVPRGGVFYIAFFCWAYTPRRREPCFARVQVYIMASLHYTITFGRSSSGFFFHAFFLCCAVRAK